MGKDDGSEQVSCNGGASKRYLYFDKMFNEAGANMFAMQETRSKQASRNLPNCWVVCGACTPQRKLGCEIWLNKQWQHRNSDTCTDIEQRHIVLVATHPRYLLVSLRAACISIGGLSAHMYDGKHNKAEVTTLCEELQQVPKRRPDPMIPMSVGLDANAKVGSIVSSSIGDCGACPQSFSGSLSERFLKDNKLFAANMFRMFTPAIDATLGGHRATMNTDATIRVFRCFGGTKESATKSVMKWT